MAPNRRETREEMHHRKWMQKLEALKEFKRNEGHCNVPHVHPILGKWVNNQRTNYKNTSKGATFRILTPDRIRMLESVGFQWEADTHAFHKALWNERYEELKEFKRVEGHCLVPVDTGGKLGKWVSTQRYHEKQHLLTPDRFQLLNDLGFVWEVDQQAAYEELWFKKFELLKAFKAKWGHCRVHTKRGGTLGLWVLTQRVRFKKKTLRADRLQLLQDLGFEWEVDVRSGESVIIDEDECDAKWPAADLVEDVEADFIDEEGDESDGKQIQDLGFEWEVDAQAVEAVPAADVDEAVEVPTDDEGGFGAKMLATDVDVAVDVLIDDEEEFDAKMPATNVEEAVEVLTVEDCDTKLPGADVAEAVKDVIGNEEESNGNLVRDLGFEREVDVHAAEVVSSEEARWNEKFALLKAFKEEHQHLDVPYKYKSGVLWNWTVRQRSYYQEEKLSQERIRKLEEVGFEWQVPHRYEKMWNEQYQNLKKYHSEHGDCLVPPTPKFKKLYNWVLIQRRNYAHTISGWKEQILSPHRIRKLEEIDFVWRDPTFWTQKECAVFMDGVRLYGHPSKTKKGREVCNRISAMMKTKTPMQVLSHFAVLAREQVREAAKQVSTRLVAQGPEPSARDFEARSAEEIFDRLLNFLMTVVEDDAADQASAVLLYSLENADRTFCSGILESYLDEHEAGWDTEARTLDDAALMKAANFLQDTCASQAVASNESGRVTNSDSIDNGQSNDRGSARLNSGENEKRLLVDILNKKTARNGESPNPPRKKSKFELPPEMPPLGISHYLTIPELLLADSSLPENSCEEILFLDSPKRQEAV